jgi:Asp-tRNA(Asn)/Glu-tRNA(Gln) amidotransferase A subunit family amidase
VEAAAAFDDLTRGGQDDLMRAEPESSSWPDSFLLHRFVPAVEYLQANRVRMRLIEELNQVFSEIDLFMGSDLGLTNLTGHPEIGLPHGFTSDGSPTSLRFTGKLFGDAEITLLAHAYQQKTNHHLRRPPLRAG